MLVVFWSQLGSEGWAGKWLTFVPETGEGRQWVSGESMARGWLWNGEVELPGELKKKETDLGLAGAILEDSLDSWPF